MKYLNYVCIFLLSSSVLLGFAKAEKSNVQAVRSTAFTVIKDRKKIYPFVAFEKVIKNMPPERCDGSWPICGGSSTATIIDEYNCRTNNIENCKGITQDQQVSSMGMMAWARKNADNAPDTLATSFTNINLDGVFAAKAIINSSSAFKFKPESCFPIDRIQNKFGNSLAMESYLTMLKDLFARNKSQTEACESCMIKSIQDGLGIEVSSNEFKKALERKTFEEFLFRIIFKDNCEYKPYNPKPNVRAFPVAGETAPKSAMIEKSKEILMTDKPILLNAVCEARNKETNECIGNHHIVITGYSKICKTATSKDNECKRIIKIEAALCSDWQKAHDDGWVDAESLADNMSEDPMSLGAMIWLEKKEMQ
ncbi:MAG: hypothetical protein WA160_02090 [Pseudobdellovibrio sp.]